MSNVAIGENAIPVVDLERLVRGVFVAADLQLLRQAVEHFGFLYVINHGISDSCIRDARASARLFFNQTLAAKQALSISRHHRGWLAAGGAQMAADVLPDMKESFIWGAALDTNHPSEHRLRGPNQWPEHLPEMHGPAEVWFECAERLACLLLAGLAVSYDLDAKYFLRHSDRPLSRASYVYYPSRVARVGLEEQFGVGPHTDFGVLTVLSQDAVGGLQVEVGENNWIDVPPKEDALIVNVGDLLCRWSNGCMQSARHRVIRPVDVDRVSLVLAFDPNPETVIDPVDFRSNEAPKPDTVTCGEYLDWRFSKAFAYRRTGEAR
ncbi:MAG: 2OG-Fe(II) oxygenase [Pseudomonadales bacterium]|nr:2OG-Fe(II) oxygenase [Pseudomonadales bacterium]